MDQINLPISLLELALITKDSNTSETFDKTVQIAQKADELGYKRVWLAEHHNMPHVASSATVVLIGHIAGKTEKIRVGSGGIMLPNHSPLVVAEQFGTLDALYPNRIDMGLGRAPGTDQLTAQALNKNFYQAAQQFPQHVAQLQKYLSPENCTAQVRAFPGEGANVPIWILGSSMDSAALAAHFGLPYAFASHFAPTHMYRAFAYYRENFKPSAYLDKPYTMSCVNLIIADTQEEADAHATCLYRMFLNIIRGTREPLSPPIESMDGIWSQDEEAYVKNMLSHSFIGTPEKVYGEFQQFLKVSKIDELMVTIPIYDQGARLRTLELSREIFGGC